MRILKQKFLITVLLLLSAINVNALDFTVNGIKYTTNDDGTTCYVARQSSSYISGKITIPSEVSYSGKQYSVTSIVDYAFSGCSSLTSVTIPNSVTSIGKGAFYSCYRLLAIDIDGSNSNYQSEDGVLFNKGMTELIQFPGGKKGEYTIPNSVTSIEDFAFYGCPGLTSVTIPNSVTSIGDNDFRSCSSLFTIDVDESNLNYQSIDGVLFNKGMTKLIRFPEGKQDEYTIPNSVTSIGDYAFCECYGLTSVTIPNSVTSIGESAFYGCFYLSSVIIPNSVTSIGEWAFYGCYGLTSVTIGDNVTSIGDYAFSGCYDLASVTIPNSVLSIGNGAFEYCYSLTFVTIGNSVTSIGECAFNGCYGLTSVTIPSSVTSIGNQAFASCEGLTSITIPNSVTSIGYQAFSYCSGLTSVTIGSSVTSIGDIAFSECSSLLAIDVDESNSNYQSKDGVLFNKGMTELIQFPGGKKGEYTIPNSVKSIGNDAFRNCSLTSVTIPNGVTSIGDFAFNECSALTSVTILCITPPTVGRVIFWNVTTQSATLYVPNKSLEIYETTTPWSDFGEIIPITTTIELTDGTPISYENDEDFATIKYTRNFTSTNWNALYVPFAMNYEDWADDFEVARLNNVNQYDDNDDGIVDRTVLESIKLKAGSKTEPNTPYMIKAKEAGEKTITLNDATICKTEELSYDVTSWYTKFTFTGTYSPVTNMATNGYYALAGGRLQQATSDAATLSPMRWYLEITDRNGNHQSLSKNITLLFDDGESTDISPITIKAKTDATIYSLDGAYMGNDSSKLAKGVYVSNGKKVIIK